ncbi:MAG: hypothetical protein UY18_C0023G0003 [Microgenomates group bacterium GW2011_GWF2_47_9]|nr:MAG: hypothetical protein UY18_C0023G0003 [Microgenomates group bacterium GW2011_GWF2_47_9]
MIEIAQQIRALPVGEWLAFCLLLAMTSFVMNVLAFLAKSCGFIAAIFIGGLFFWALIDTMAGTGQWCTVLWTVGGVAPFVMKGIKTLQGSSVPKP